MKSKKVGKSISKPKPGAEVSAITRNGIWLLISDAEYFLDNDEYPWFKDAHIESVFNVMISGGGHLFWPDLDVDLMVDGIANRELYPLIAKPGKRPRHESLSRGKSRPSGILQKQ